jgi:hypothetical protein
MRPTSVPSLAFAAAIALICSAGVRAATVHNYENLTESFLGSSFTDGGVTYHDINTSDVVFPDGSGTTGEDLGDQAMIENATLLYNDFPDFGSPINALTFGKSYIVGNNLSLGAISQVTMDLDAPASAASFDLSYYENGPWGGIVYHLDGLKNGQTVGASSFTIAGDDLNGRDNIAFTTMSVAAAAGSSFDQLKFYATFGASFSAPRGLIDDLTITAVPEPASLLVLGAAPLAMRRRRVGGR